MDRNKYIISIPVILIFFLVFTYVVNSGIQENPKKDNYYSFFKEFNFINTSENRNIVYNILNDKDVSWGLKDTVYTDKDYWLELRIDQQMLYEHSRNGNVSKFPISSGNKGLSRSIESRPGLFAVFHKEELHLSTQYNNAEMLWFMPFNQGIGFHALNGTGYYGSLGVAPSSHGCIRMRHEDVKKIFRDCPIGTLVLAHRGTTSRVVGFAPKDIEQEEIDKDEMKFMVANNLNNILQGNYYVAERKFFVINPKIIPPSGIYIGYDRKLPEKQKVAKSFYYFEQPSDRLTLKFRISEISTENIYADDESDSTEIGEIKQIINTEKKETALDESSKEIIKKYFHNPIGILPYFGPNK